MKRILCLLFALVLLLCGCGTSQSPETETTAPASEVETEASNGMRMTQESNVRKATYENKDAYTDFLAQTEKLFLIPGLKQVLTPQGIAVCPTTGRTYISAYSVDDVPSAVAVTEVGTNELVAEYYLFNEDGSPFTSHVGGIALTETHMYISDNKDEAGNYRIAVIPLADLPSEGSHDITVKDSITSAVSPSFLNFSDGYLWVGNFYHPSADYVLSPNLEFTTTADDGSEYGCYILGFDMNQDGHNRLVTDGSYPIPDVILAAPNRIQGMTQAGTNKVVLSQSYGRANDSTLYIYDLDLSGEPDMQIPLDGHDVPAFLLDGKRMVQSINSIPMSEGLATGPDARVLVLYESGAIRYEDGKHRTSYVWALTVE